MSSDHSATPTAGTGTGPFSAADIKRRMAEREAAKAAERRRERCNVAGNAIAKHRDRKASTRTVAGQEFPEIRRNTRKPQHAGASVEEVYQLVRRHPLLLKEIQHHARVQLAATGTHRQPVERGEPHCRGNRNPVPHCASRAAIAEMRHDDATLGNFRRPLGQYRRDVFVGQAVKTIAPYALLKKRIGQSKCLIDLRRGAVKCGIEARHLRQFRIECYRHLDRREIVRLVQGRQRHQCLQLGQQIRCDPGRSRVTQAAVYVTVSVARLLGAYRDGVSVIPTFGSPGGTRHLWPHSLQMKGCVGPYIEASLVLTGLSR